MLKINRIHLFLEKNRFREELLYLGEIFYWLIIILMSSILFIQLHGPLRVHDGYYEYAAILKSQIFGSSSVGTIIDTRNIVNYRFVYSFLAAIISGTFNIGIFESGVIISLFSGIGCIFYSSKLASVVLEEKNVVRLYRMTIGTFSGFIIYWAKFASDMLFCFFVLASLFTIIKIWKNSLSTENVIQYCLWTSLAIFTRELGIFLLIPMLYSLMKNKELGAQIKLTGTIMIGFILTGMIYFIIRWKSLVNSYGWIYYFYNEVWSFDVPNAEIYPENLSVVLDLFIDSYFTPITFFANLSSLLYTTSIVLPLLFIIFIIEKKYGLLNIKMSWKKNKPLLLYLSFIVPYLIALFILQARFMNERYLLVLIPFSLLLLLINGRETTIKLSKSNQLTLKWFSEKTALKFLIITNLLILVIRIAYLMIFS